MQREILTLSNATKSAAWSNVRPEMSSTMRFKVGSSFVTVGGGREEAEGADVSPADVARTRKWGL